VLPGEDFVNNMRNREKTESIYNFFVFLIEIKKVNTTSVKINILKVLILFKNTFNYIFNAIFNFLNVFKDHFKHLQICLTSLSYIFLWFHLN